MKSTGIGRREAIKQLGFSLASLCSIGFLPIGPMRPIPLTEKYLAQFISVGSWATHWLQNIWENHHHHSRSVAITNHPLEVEHGWVDCHIEVCKQESHGLPAYPAPWENPVIDNFERINRELIKGEKNVIFAALGDFFADGAASLVMAESIYSGIPTQALVTLPFSFQGKRIRNFALKALESMRLWHIPVIVIDGDKFVRSIDEKLLDILITLREEVKQACLSLAKRSTALTA